MKFRDITIKHFRNFEDITIALDNKNMFFGLNDVGKTNFLYALRYLFDKDIRKQNMTETDFYHLDTSKNIEIIVSIDISDQDDDSDKIRAKIRGGLLSSQDIVYIRLESIYDKKESIANPTLYWGGDLTHLYEMNSKGIYFDIDFIFNPIYIDAYVDLNALFKKNIKKLIENDSTNDSLIESKIKKNISDLNDNISSLSGVSKFENKITPIYKRYRKEKTSISIKSEIAVKGLYNGIVPYLKNDNDNYLYPTSGEGRKKLLVYSIYELLSNEYVDKKINIFLIEEPENHLHRSLQIELSKLLFSSENFKYLFLTTHSSYILSEIDNANLVRIFNEDKITSKSILYTVPSQFKSHKSILNKGLVDSLFYDRILLVEGPSELTLFEKVLEEVCPTYEIDGGHILYIRGVGFKPYLDILKPLGIECTIKTDNDLKGTGSGKYSVLGFIRINKYITQTKLPITPITATGYDDVEKKRKIYEDNEIILNEARLNDRVYLSKVSLEEDLDEVLHENLLSYIPSSSKDPVKYLKEKKGENMVNISLKLTHEDCEKIYNHYNFACLKEVVK